MNCRLTAVAIAQARRRAIDHAIRALIEFGRVEDEVAHCGVQMKVSTAPRTKTEPAERAVPRTASPGRGTRRSQRDARSRPARARPITNIRATWPTGSGSTDLQVEEDQPQRGGHHGQNDANGQQAKARQLGSQRGVCQRPRRRRSARQRNDRRPPHPGARPVCFRISIQAGGIRLRCHECFLLSS